MYKSDLKHPSETLQDKLHRLYTLNRDKAVDLSFRPPFLNLLHAFGNPQDHLPPTIHVAGTNGKGSTIATLKSIYEAAGYSVHVYTSPHLIRFNERIVLNGKPIDNAELEALIDEALDKNDGASCTFFEITTAIALTAFARHKADICLLEVGMGGRLDCTNIIQHPVLSLINTISLDHTEFLGDTYTKIAKEKAGIMKPDVPCIIGHQHNDEVSNALTETAHTTNTPLISLEDTVDQYSQPALHGQHQRKNINLALTAIKTLQDRFPVNTGAINTGLHTIHWPARLQKLPSTAFGLTEQTQIWLDGGHNEDAAHALSHHIQSLKSDGKITLILCMMKHKNPKQFLDILQPHCDQVFLTQLPDEPASLSTSELSNATGNNPKDIQTHSYREALETIKAQEEYPAHILIAGSLYLAGHVLQDLETLGHN